MSSRTEPRLGFEPNQLKRLQPTEFLSSCLSQNLRPDGRALQDTRPLKYDTGSISSAHASTVLSIGKTSVLSAIKFEIAEPDISKPNQGFIVPNVDLGPMCCPKFRAGPPNDESQILSTRLRDLLTSSDLVPLSSLVIQPGKSVWVIYVDIVCLSNDGNLFDAIVMSTTLALKNARLPLVTFDGDRDQVVLRDPRSSASTKPLEVRRSLYACSFGFVNDAILPDPTLFEEDLASGFLSIVLDDQAQIRQLWYAGAAATQASQDRPSHLAGWLPVLDPCFQYAKNLAGRRKSAVYPDGSVPG